MKKIIIPTLIGILLSTAGWAFLWFGSGRGYINYLNDWEYRRLHPELIPSPDIIRIFDMGHTTSYTSWMWLSLIQYIGDNIRDNKFLDFSHTLIANITTLHPYFIRPYEIDLIFAPFSAGESITPEQKAKNKIISNQAIELGKKGILTLCEGDKISKIKNREISEKLWNDPELKNPCASGMLPYYIGFAMYQMSESKTEASEYYKIASMNDDAPKASRILSILSLSALGDYRASAMNFALIGSTGYDMEPYTCQKLANHLIETLASKEKIDIAWINTLLTAEHSLKDTRHQNNPISNSSNNCYDMTTRSIKEIYLSYIADIARDTTAGNGNDLVKLGKIKAIPTLSTQSGYTVRKKNDIWVYQDR